jgi:hypothetical protein
MFEGKSVRSIFLFICLIISFSSAACVPCAKEPSVIVVTQAKPKFPTSYSSTESSGQVTFKLDLTSVDNKLTNIQLINLSPSDVDKKVILEMIKNSRYRLHSDEKHFPCSVEGYELSLNFDLPQKIILLDVGDGL